MNQRVKIIFIACCVTMVIFFINCSQVYKAGNLISLDYSVETSLRSTLIQAYCDSLIVGYGYGVPVKWSSKNKLVELDSINNKRIYFKHDPEEMYLIPFGGMLELTDVYNPHIRSDGGYVSSRDLMSKDEELRVKKRFKTEIIDKIESMAKRDGLSDSVIYKN